MLLYQFLLFIAINDVEPLKITESVWCVRVWYVNVINIFCALELMCEIVPNGGDGKDGEHRKIGGGAGIERRNYHTDSEGKTKKLEGDGKVPIKS